METDTSTDDSHDRHPEQGVDTHPFQPVQELLEQIVGMHERWQAELERRDGPANAPVRVRAVLDYLHGSERELSDVIRGTLERGDDVLECVVQTAPADLLRRALCSDGCVASLPMDELIERFRERNRELEDFYQQLRDRLGPRADEVLGQVATAHVRIQQRLSEALLDF